MDVVIIELGIAIDVKISHIISIALTFKNRWF